MQYLVSTLCQVLTPRPPPLDLALITPQVDPSDTSAEIEQRKAEAKYSRSKETKIRKWLEKKFGVPFKKKRPKWNKNPLTGKALELDMYNEGLKLAIEFQGRQHFEFVEKFHKTQADFEMGRKRDQFKRLNCQRNKVKLVEIPYWCPDEELDKYLTEQIGHTLLLGF